MGTKITTIEEKMLITAWRNALGYEPPKGNSRAKKIVEGLVHKGLLEQSKKFPGIFRPTRAGFSLVEFRVRAGVLRSVPATMGQLYTRLRQYDSDWVHSAVRRLHSDGKLVVTGYSAGHEVWGKPKKKITGISEKDQQAALRAALRNMK